jgi:hypothetical protein
MTFLPQPSHPRPRPHPRPCPHPHLAQAHALTVASLHNHMRTGEKDLGGNGPLMPVQWGIRRVLDCHYPFSTYLTHSCCLCTPFLNMHPLMCSPSEPFNMPPPPTCSLPLNSPFSTCSPHRHVPLLNIYLLSTCSYLNMVPTS